VFSNARSKGLCALGFERGISMSTHCSSIPSISQPITVWYNPRAINATINTGTAHNLDLRVGMTLVLDPYAFYGETTGQAVNPTNATICAAAGERKYKKFLVTSVNREINTRPDPAGTPNLRKGGLCEVVTSNDGRTPALVTGAISVGDTLVPDPAGTGTLVGLSTIASQIEIMAITAVALEANASGTNLRRVQFGGIQG
jgi:hypothetical protein